MKIPQINSLSRASQLSLLAVVILLGAVFFTVNGALQQQHNTSSHASGTVIGSGRVYRFDNRCGSGQAMTVSNNSMNNDAHIIERPWASGGSNKNQEWLLQSLGNGYYAIRPLSTYKYLNVYQGSKSQGAQIIQWAGTNSPYPNEQWKITKLSNGYYTIKSKNSGMAIGLYACTTQKGLNIRQYTYSGQQRLQWKITQVSYKTPKPSVSAPSCINKNYTGSRVKISWSNPNVSYVDVGTDTAFNIGKFFNKHVSGQSTDAPTGFTTDHYDTNKFVMQPDTTYYVRTWDGLLHSYLASFSIPDCSATPPHPSNGNYIQNYSFENGKNYWYLNQTSPGSGSFAITTNTAEEGPHSAVIDVTGTNSNSWYVQLMSLSKLSMVSGTTYTASFWAKASTSRPIETVIQQWGSPYAVYADHKENLTTSWQYYTFTYKASKSQPYVALRIDLAQHTGNVWFDNVSYKVGGASCVQRPACLSANPPCMLMEPLSGWCSGGGSGGGGPTATPTPTSTPTPTPTLVPSSAPSSAPSSSPSSQPSSPPQSGSTLLDLTVGLHGIGTGGDSANPHSTGNMDPKRPTRAVTVEVYDASNQLFVTQHGTVTYDKSSGKFHGTINLGLDFTTGLYTVKVKTDQYLRSLVPGIQTITAGQTTKLPTVTLVAGDINGDNAINIVDYNILIGCYSDLLPAVDCSAKNNILADLNDDGHVNQFDYNLFLRELSNVGGQ